MALNILRVPKLELILLLVRLALGPLLAAAAPPDVVVDITRLFAAEVHTRLVRKYQAVLKAVPLLPEHQFVDAAVNNLSAAWDPTKSSAPSSSSSTASAVAGRAADSANLKARTLGIFTEEVFRDLGGAEWSRAAFDAGRGVLTAWRHDVKTTNPLDQLPGSVEQSVSSDKFLSNAVDPALGSRPNENGFARHDLGLSDSDLFELDFINAGLFAEINQSDVVDRKSVIHSVFVLLLGDAVGDDEYKKVLVEDEHDRSQGFLNAASRQDADDGGVRQRQEEELDILEMETKYDQKIRLWQPVPLLRSESSQPACRLFFERRAPQGCIRGDHNCVPLEQVLNLVYDEGHMNNGHYRAVRKIHIRFSHTNQEEQTLVGVVDEEGETGGTWTEEGAGLDANSPREQVWMQNPLIQLERICSCRIHDTRERDGIHSSSGIIRAEREMVSKSIEDFGLFSLELGREHEMKRKEARFKGKSRGGRRRCNPYRCRCGATEAMLYMHRFEYEPLALQSPEVVPLIEREDASGSGLLSIFVFLMEMELYSLNRAKTPPDHTRGVVEDAFKRLSQRRQEREKLDKRWALIAELRSYDANKILKGGDILSVLAVEGEYVASSVACSQDEDVSEFVHTILASFTEEKFFSVDELLKLSGSFRLRLSEQALRSLHADAVRRRAQMFRDRDALKRADALVEILRQDQARAPSVAFVLDIVCGSDHRSTSDIDLADAGRFDVDPAFGNPDPVHQIASSSMKVPVSYLIGVLVDWGWVATRGSLSPISHIAGLCYEDSFRVDNLSDVADVFLGMIARPRQIFTQHMLVTCAHFLHTCHIINNLVPSGSDAADSGTGTNHLLPIRDHVLDPCSSSDCGVSDCPLSLSSSRAPVQRILPGNLPGQFGSGDLADDRSTICPASDAGGGGLPPAIDITHRGSSPRQVIGLHPLFAAPHGHTPVNIAPEILPAVGDQQSPPGLSTSPTPRSSCPQAGSPGDGVPCGGGNVSNSGPKVASTPSGPAATPALGPHPKRVHLAIDDKSDPHADQIANGILYVVLMILFLSLVLSLGCKSAFAEGGVLEAVALADMEDRNVSWHLPT